MAVSISQYIEAVVNPNGRFRTLKGIYPLLDESGEPRMQAGDICADFEMVFEGERYVLKCLLGTSTKHRERLREIALFTRLIDTPYLTAARYLEDEITVFDTNGEPRIFDVLLIKKPEGTKLCDYLADAVQKRESTVVWKFGQTIPAMARWIWENEFSAGSVSYKSLYVSPRSTPVLTDYTHSQRKRSLTDIRALCSLEAALYCCACEPRLFAPFIQEHLLSRGKLIALVGELNELLQDENTSTLTAFLALLSVESGNYDEYVAYMFELADKLAMESQLRIPSLSDMADVLTSQKDNSPSKVCIENTGNLSKYNYLGELSCNLMRAFDGQKWCYLDKTGKAVIWGDFLDASDFEEGRAVVETSGGFGLIDDEGNFVISPNYDDLDWDSYNNVAIATKDGKSGVFSRGGEVLTELEYDQILNCSEGLIPAKKEGRYGYLNKEGSVVIDFKFEDAFGFRGGVARVKRSGREVIIDTEGKEIDRIIK